MRVYKGMADLQDAPQRAVVTIGNFDGVHVGHQDLLGEVVKAAARTDGTPVAITFRPHPQFVLRPTGAPLLINTYEEKIELLGKYGMKVVIDEPFSREFSNISPDQFVDQFLLKRLNLNILYLGYDFAFGKERAGSVEVMRRLCAERKIELHVVPAHRVEEKIVSSSLIRQCMESGELEQVNKYLGRKFFLRGLVWRGEGRGRTIGIPTANLQTENRKYPKVGVYATRCKWRGTWHKSVSNIGYNPTFKGDGTDLPLKIETHLFDFDHDMYGDEIEVEFYSFLRSEVKFNGVDALLSQIKIDFAQAKEVLKAIP